MYRIAALHHTVALRGALQAARYGASAQKKAQGIAALG
jgi:hypothetical protein